MFVKLLKDISQFLKFWIRWSNLKLRQHLKIDF